MSCSICLIICGLVATIFAQYAPSPQAGNIPLQQDARLEAAQPAPLPYNFNYNIQNPLTGDFKFQRESREGQVVRGAYSLLEPDGRTRIVEYTADDNGFNAVIRRGGADPQQ